MICRRSASFVLPVLMLLSLFAAKPVSVAAEETSLDRYLAKPDATYEWKVVKTVPAKGATIFVVDLKSQTWRTTKDVNQTVWQHWLTVIKPDKPASKTGFLFIAGGANGKNPPATPDDKVVQIARATNTVVAELKMVPNQPLIFHGDNVKRVEDDLIGYTWDQYLKTGDDTWPARLPMVKSAHRAMDCVQELLKSEQGGGIEIEKFVVAGGSKRGWTTWLTGATDKRVAAIIPLVIDVLNVNVSMRHHFAAYGFWAPAVSEYVDHRIMQRMNDPKLVDLYAIEDPISYKNRLTLPKFIVNATGDQFFLPDSSQFYFDELQGEKYLRYVPNADHSLGGTDALESIVAFYELIINGKPRPEFEWSMEGDGAIRVKSKTAPKQVTLWQATNPKARDFRVESVGKIYKSTALKPEADGTWIGKVEKPAEGWTAYFVELAFDTGIKVPLKMTTPVRVIPDVLPHADKDPVAAD
ncbi:MAG: PhoPQ-activated pathogenicity-related family protein [Phycisphaerae bacterium]